MFGREYASHPEVLLYSFAQINASYKSKAKKSKGLILFFQKIYIRLFGIPEMGFQIRSMYFENAINEKLQNKKFKKILDAGSGIGTYAFWLSKKFPDAKVTGGDIDREKIEVSKKLKEKLNLKNSEFIYLDITKSIKSQKKYDLLINIDVLEHIKNYRVAINNFYNMLVPGGYLFIHTPQPHQKRIFKSFEKWSHEDHVHEGYEPEELKKTLKDLGFKIILVKESFGWFGKLSWELNHISFKKGFVTAGIFYPLLYFIGKIDLFKSNRNGLGISILAKKL